MEEEEISIAESSGEKLRPWSDITLGLLSRILSYLPYKYHVFFRATCKSWSGVIPFHGEHRSPLLFLFRGDEYCLFNPIHNTYRTPIQQPPAATILHSDFGWLLMQGLSYSNIFFFNIFTKETIDLPNWPSDLQIAKFSFSSSPTSSSSTCFVVGVIIIDKLARVCLTKPGEKDWIVTGWDFTRDSKTLFLLSECNPIFHNGRFFCLDMDGWMASFDPEDPEGTWIIFGKPFSTFGRLRQRAFMVESDDGELLSATITEDGRQVSVYKLHSSQEYWINMTDLGNKILYLSHAGSQVQSTNFKGMGNRIYLPRFRDNHLVFYSLDTRKYHSYGYKFFSQNLYHLSESLDSTWIKPIF